MIAEKFASEIFGAMHCNCVLHCTRNSRSCARAARRIKRFAIVRIAINGDPVFQWGRLHGGPQLEFLPQMPRYFFNTRIGEEVISDPDGEVLRDPDRAWEMARAMIRELIRTEGADAALLNAVIEVTDDDGDIVLEFPFSEAIVDHPDMGSVTKH